MTRQVQGIIVFVLGFISIILWGEIIHQHIGWWSLLVWNCPVGFLFGYWWGYYYLVRDNAGSKRSY